MLDTFKKATPAALAAINEEMDVRRAKEVFLLFAMGSQFDLLIYQALAKLGVYCLVADPASVTAEDVRTLSPIGIILSGGPASVHSEPPPFDANIFNLGIPTFGICLGFQMLAKHIGVRVESGQRQLNVYEVIVHTHDPLFLDCPNSMPVLQSHGDEVRNGGVLHVSATCGKVIAAASHKHFHGVQFHPECPETTYCPQIFKNFCFEVCKAKNVF